MGDLWKALDVRCCFLASLNLELPILGGHPVGALGSFMPPFWVAASVAPSGLLERSFCNSMTSFVVSGRVLLLGHWGLKCPVSPQLWHLFPEEGGVEPGLTSPYAFFLNIKAVTTCCTSVRDFWIFAWISNTCIIVLCNSRWVCTTWASRSCIVRSYLLAQCLTHTHILTHCHHPLKSTVLVLPEQGMFWFLSSNKASSSPTLDRWKCFWSPPGKTLGQWMVWTSSL